MCFPMTVVSDSLELHDVAVLVEPGDHRHIDEGLWFCGEYSPELEIQLNSVSLSTACYVCVT